MIIRYDGLLYTKWEELSSSILSFYTNEIEYAGGYWILSARIVLILNYILLMVTSILVFYRRKTLTDVIYLTDFTANFKVTEKMIFDTHEHHIYGMVWNAEKKVINLCKNMEKRKLTIDPEEQISKANKYLLNQEQKVNEKFDELDRIMAEEEKLSQLFEKTKNTIMTRFEDQELSTDVKCAEKINCLVTKGEELQKKLERIMSDLIDTLNIDIIVRT